MTARVDPGSGAVHRLVGSAMGVAKQALAGLATESEHPVADASAGPASRGSAQPEPAAGVWLRLDDVVETVEEAADGLLVRHSCDMPLCVNPGHLSLGTHKDNAGDMVRRGRALNGERNVHAKLTEFQIAEIISLVRSGEHLQRDIAQRFGVSQSAVSFIALGKRWAHHIEGQTGIENQPKKEQVAMSAIEATRRGLIAKRVSAGATTPVGRRLSILISLLETEPADEDHDRRRKASLARFAGEVEALMDADRVGAA
jgi:hypothetical protein